MSSFIDPEEMKNICRDKCNITVITATYNSSKQIPRLIESLEKQSNKNFVWVVADGGSTDDTTDKINKIKGVEVLISSEGDFGVYDAINRAINLSSTDYYVVIGSDDFFYPNAIGAFNNAISGGNYDIITAKLKFGAAIRGVRGGSSLINKQFSYVSAHSVSTLFKKKLHKQVGLYSKEYPIAADQYFILQAVKIGAKILKIEEVVGCFTLGGVSSTDTIGCLTESLRIQMKYESKALSLIIFFLKVIKNYKKLL